MSEVTVRWTGSAEWIECLGERSFLCLEQLMEHRALSQEVLQKPDSVLGPPILDVGRSEHLL